MIGFGIPIIGDLFSTFAGWISDAAGWAIDSVLAAITTWVVMAVIGLIEAIWGFIDMSSNPELNAEWFSGAGSTPVGLALTIGGVMLGLTVLAAIIRAIAGGSPGGVIKAVSHDLPLAVFAMFATVGFTAVALDASNSISDWVWQGTRDDARTGLDGLATVMQVGAPGSGFLAVVLGVLMIAAMLFLWVVLYVREALVYLVIVFSVAFAWPMIVFPPLRDTGKKAGELILALILAKPVIALAMSVGVSAMAAAGHGEQGITNPTRMLGTLIVGVVTFGMAAFMPFLVWKLLPIVGAAVVAQGVASAPMRAAQQGMQMQFYGSRILDTKTHGRSSSGTAGVAGQPSGPAPTTGTGGSGAGGSATAAGGPVGAAAAVAMKTGASAKRAAASTAGSVGDDGGGS